MVDTRAALTSITRRLTDEGVIAGAGSCELARTADPHVFRATVSDLEGNVRLYRVPGATADEVASQLLAAIGCGV
jgi:hypothetical protein